MEEDDEWWIMDEQAIFILNILQVDRPVIQGLLRRISTLPTVTTELADTLETQLEHLGHLASQDLGLDDQIEQFLKSKKRFLAGLHMLRRNAFHSFADADRDSHQKQTVARYINIGRELEELEFVLATERAVLCIYETEIKLGISSCEGAVHRIGLAYAKSVYDVLARPSIGRLGPTNLERALEPDGHRTEEQQLFRTRVLEHYFLEKLPNPPLGSPQRFAWCPVTGVQNADEVEVTHILPYSIGGMTAARILGRQESEGYECIWGASNGMVLGCYIEEAFDEGSIAFAPCQRGLEMVLLDQTISEKPSGSSSHPTFASLDGHVLTFEVDHRPSLANLYIRALITVLRRRRRGRPNWRTDLDKVFIGRSWLPQNEKEKEKLLRAETLCMLAAQVGDLPKPMVIDFSARVFEISGLVEAVDKEEGLQFTGEDTDLAVVVAGTWHSQKELEQWEMVSEHIDELIDNPENPAFQLQSWSSQRL